VFKSVNIGECHYHIIAGGQWVIELGCVNNRAHSVLWNDGYLVSAGKDLVQETPMHFV